MFYIDILKITISGRTRNATTNTLIDNMFTNVIIYFLNRVNIATSLPLFNAFHFSDRIYNYIPTFYYIYFLETDTDSIYSKKQIVAIFGTAHCRSFV